MLIKNTVFTLLLMSAFSQNLTSDSLNFSHIEFQKDKYLHQDVSIEWLYFYAYLHDDSLNQDFSYTGIFTSDKESQITIQTIDSIPGSVYQYSAKSMVLKNDILAYKNKKSFDSIFIDSSLIRIVSANKDFKSNLEFIPSQKMILLNDSGYMSISPSFSYYYSIPRMQVNGNITINGKIHKVTGIGWHDHQWGDFVVGTNPYTWFSIMFENGKNAVIWKFKDEPLAQINLFDADSIDTTFSQSCTPIKSNDLIIRSLSYKKAKDSEKVFPYGWYITSDSLKLQILIVPKIMNFHLQSVSAPLYQGPCDVFGVINGEKFNGFSHMELTFFNDYYNQGKFLVNYQEEIYQNLINTFKENIENSISVIQN